MSDMLIIIMRKRNFWVDDLLRQVKHRMTKIPTRNNCQFRRQIISV